MGVRLSVLTKLQAPPIEAFDLSLSVAAHVASMARFRERQIGPSRSDALGLGDEITWFAWHLKLPWRLTSRIVTYDRPRLFVDEQIRGPFHRFWHQHTFEPSDEGSRMTDIVEFEAPFGWLGRTAERWFLARYILNLIEERNRYLAEQFQPAGDSP